MKKIVIILGIATLLCASACKSSNTVKLETPQDSISWVIGESYGRSLKDAGIKMDKKLVLQALEATLDGKDQPITQEQYQTILNDLNNTIAMQQHMKMKEQQANNEAQEKAYFEKLIQQNPNIKKAKEGFYYEVLQEGNGPKAVFGSVVEFDYRAYFATSGQLYDQTYGNRDAIRHVVGNPMFQGMQEAFPYMNAGSKYRFYFPSNKAFGPQGDAQNGIPPFSTMIYEIELHKVSSK
jgi:FKBP-type peptidyl-prolyl cis-trans isomerase